MRIILIKNIQGASILKEISISRSFRGFENSGRARKRSCADQQSENAKAIFFYSKYLNTFEKDLNKTEMKYRFFKQKGTLRNPSDLVILQLGTENVKKLGDLVQIIEVSSLKRKLQFPSGFGWLKCEQSLLKCKEVIEDHMTKELLVNFTVCSLYRIHFVSEQKLYSVICVKDSDLCMNMNYEEFLANLDISTTLGLFLGTGQLFFRMPVRRLNSISIVNAWKLQTHNKGSRISV